MMNVHFKIPKKSTYLTLSVILSVTLVYVLYLYAILGFGISPGMDDAYIVEHSVKGILSGQETSYINSSPWDGVTSPVYVFILVLFSTIMPVTYAHYLISALSILWLVAGWFILCKKHQLNDIVTIFIISITLSIGVTTYQLLNGLETGMAMAVLTWLLIAINKDVLPLWFYILTGIMCFLRPEFAALSAILVIYILMKRPMGYLKGLIIICASFISFSSLLYLCSGHFIPNTMSAKSYFFAEGCRDFNVKKLSIIRRINAFIDNIGFYSLGFILVLLSKYRIILMLFIASFISAYFYKLPGALDHNYFRYPYLLLPIALYGWVLFVNFYQKQNSYRVKIAIILSLLLCISIFFTTEFLTQILIIIFGVSVLVVNQYRKFIVTYVFSIIIFMLLVFSYTIPQISFIEKEAGITKDNFQASYWITQHIPHHSVILIHDAGLISEIVKNPLVDLVGLKTPSSIDIHRKMTYQQCRRTPDAVATIAENAQAQYFVVNRDWNRFFRLTQSLKDRGWDVKRIDNERGATHYQVYKITKDISQ
ncbi:MAG: hypothetical protein IJ187_08095 [Neisseriaceae bacterium]|nr:hypothetical protein [Neisseriaceae bacterium]